MVFRRGTRPSWYFSARTRTGWQQLCTHTPDKRLGHKMEVMWEELADRHRAWDILDPALAPEGMRVSVLFDLWVEVGRKIEELRRRLRDRDIEPLVAEWDTAHRPEVKADSADHALGHVRYLLPEGTPRLASSVTLEWLTQRLAVYPGKRNTRRKVHSSWSVFFEYATATAGAFSRTPMLDVKRPSKEKMPIRFYELRDVQRIVGWFSEPVERAYFALLYGTGMDVSAAFAVLRGDLQEKHHEIRAPGTKAHTRDRVCLIADWAWPIVWAYVRTLHPDARLFPDFDRFKVSDWHRAATGDGWKNTHGEIVTPGLKLPRQYPLKCARHHWAVRQLRAGAAVRVVSEQLGHSSTQVTFEVYGLFVVKTEDRQRAEALATQYDANEQEAQRNAQ